MFRNAVASILLIFAVVLISIATTGRHCPGYVLLDQDDLTDVRGGHTCYGYNEEGGQCESHPSSCDQGMTEPCEKVTVTNEDGEEEEEWQCKNRGQEKYKEGSGETHYPKWYFIDENEEGSGYDTLPTETQTFVCHKLVTCDTGCDTPQTSPTCKTKDERDGDANHEYKEPYGDVCTHPHEDL